LSRKEDSPKNKNKKKVFAGLGEFFVPKMAQDTSLRRGKSRPGGAKISPGGGGQLPMYAEQNE